MSYETDILHGQSSEPQPRPVTLLGFTVDNGSGAHAGNAPEGWDTTPVARVRLDYLRGQPVVLVRLEGNVATELLAELAYAVALQGRHRDRSER